MKLKEARSILICLLLLSMLSTLTLAVIRYTVEITGTGTIVVTEPAGGKYYSLAVYEKGTTTPCTSIDWGKLNPEAVKTYEIDIKNTGTVTLILNMTYIMDAAIGTLTWNKEDYALSTGLATTAVLTLTVASDAPEGPFSCTIKINGEA